MNIDFQHFTPWLSAAGGALLGLATALYLLGSGRVAGISGIVAGALRLGRPEAARIAFIGGLLLAPWLWQLFAPLPEAREVAGVPLLVAAGLAVGIGVRLGNGCTSGHGVCGIARGSTRSVANVLVFIATGLVTVALLRHLI